MMIKVVHLAFFFTCWGTTQMQYISNLQGSPLMLATACRAKIQWNRVVNMQGRSHQLQPFFNWYKIPSQISLLLHFVGQVFFFLGSSGSIRTHSKSVKLLEYGIFSASWRSPKCWEIPNGFYRDNLGRIFPRILVENYLVLFCKHFLRNAAQTVISYQLSEKGQGFNENRLF